MLASLMRKIIKNQVKWGGEEKSTYNFFLTFSIAPFSFLV